MTTHQVGRSHARRQVEEIDADGMTVWLERLNADDYLTAGTLTRYKDRAIAVLKAHRIPVDDLLAQAPGGSMVRDYVLNLLPIIRVKTPTEEKLRKQYLAPTDPLQLEPAARLLEMALHLEAYGKSADPGLVYRFGRLALLFDIYAETSEKQRLVAEKERGERVGEKVDGADSSFTVGDVIDDILRDHPEEKPKQLWDIFINELWRCGLSPRTDETHEVERKWQVYYGDGKHMTLGTFENRVSTKRKKRKTSFHG